MALNSPGHPNSNQGKLRPRIMKSNVMVSPKIPVTQETPSFNILGVNNITK